MRERISPHRKGRPRPVNLASAPVEEAIDQSRYRQALGHFATGVTVVATVHEDIPSGLCVNSFTSVSLDPPLVAFCVARHSTSWSRIRTARRFCVNILAEDQEEVSRLFATPGADRFRGIGWRLSSWGSPLLTGVLAWVDCTLEAENDAGDHVLVIGRVRDIGVGEKGRPLVFYRGGYGRFKP